LIERMLGRCRTRSPRVETIVRIGASASTNCETAMPIRRSLVPSASPRKSSRPAAKIFAASRLGSDARARVRNLKSAVLSLSLTLEAARSAALSRAESFSHNNHSRRSRGRNAAISSSKVASAERLLALRSGVTGRASRPRASREKAQALGPLTAFELGFARGRKVCDEGDAIARQAGLLCRSDAADEGHRFWRQKALSLVPDTANPRGLSRSEAILARNLLVDNPIDTVMPMAV
jgi:hypothetical protein